MFFIIYFLTKPQNFLSLSLSIKNLCSQEDEKILKNTKESLQRIKILKKHNLFQFIYLFSIFEKDNEKRFYKIKEYTNKKRGKIRKKKITVDWKLKDEDIENLIEKQKQVLSSNNRSKQFESSFNSQTSVNTFISSLNVLSIKQKNKKNQFQQKRKYYMIFFNCFIVLMSIFCLIFENYVNQRLKGKYIL